MGAQAVQGALVEMVQGWLAHHPLLRWGLLHPLWALLGGVLLVFIFGGLLRAIAQLTEQLWLKLLQLPIRISQWIFAQFPLWIGQPLMATPLPREKSGESLNSLKDLLITNERLSASQPLSEQQIAEIMLRLEHLQQEQSQLLQDIKTLLQSSPALSPQQRWALSKQTALRRGPVFLRERLGTTFNKNG